MNLDLDKSFDNFFIWYRTTAAVLLNRYVEGQLHQFRHLHNDLRMANMPIMVREYVSIIFFSAIFAFAVSLPASLIVIYIISHNIATTFVFSLIIAAMATLAAFAITYEYPSMRVGERQRSIDNNLPFAALYMNTIAGTGAPPSLMFKLLSNFKEYGEVSVEAQSITEDIEVMGQDIQQALVRAADRTPSVEFKDLLWSMVTTIVRGGDMRFLLLEKSKLLMDKYRRTIEEYTNELSMYVEIYITLIIVGSIFSTVMLTIMGAISGFESLKSMQQMLVFVFLPFSSLMFIALLKLTSPVS